MNGYWEEGMIPPIDWYVVMKEEIDKAVMEERKRCASYAKVVINSPDDYNWAWDAAKEILEKIEGGGAN